MRVNRQRCSGTGHQWIPPERRAAVDIDHGAAQDAARAHQVRAREIADLQAVISEQVADRGMHPLHFGPQQIHARGASQPLREALAQR